MEPVRRAAAGVLLMAMIAGTSHRVAGQVDQPDAARTYEVIWEGVDPALWQAASELRLSTAWYPDKQESRVVAANTHVVERLVDVTRLDPVPLNGAELGWELLGGETRNYRRTAYLFTVDAVRLLASDDADGAATRITALLRMGGQLAQEPRLNSTVQAATCIQMAEELMERACRAPTLSEAGRRALTQSLVTLDQGDPAGFKTGVSGSLLLMDWIEAGFKGSDAGDKLVESMPLPEDRKRPLAEGEEERGRRWGRRGERTGTLWPSREVLTALRQLDGEQLEEAIKDFRAMHDAAMSAWVAEDAEDQLERIDVLAERGGFGLLARAMPPYYSRQYRNSQRIVQNMKNMRLFLTAR